MKVNHEHARAEILQNSRSGIIDDDQSMRWVLDKTLSNNGYQVSAFESGSVALASFKRTAPEERPSLIITDVRMPGINGFELLKQIKNISPQTPIIVMTAYTDLDTTVQAFHEGAFEYLPKPFDIDDALELVARACEPVAETSSGNAAPATRARRLAGTLALVGKAATCSG